MQVNTLKILRKNDHPEMIDKYRCERAAAYLNKQTNPTEPPLPKTPSSNAYKPPGHPVSLFGNSTQM